MKRLVMALGTLAIVASACKPLVINGGGGGSNNTGGESASGGSGGAEPATTVVAVRLGDALPDNIGLASIGGPVPTDPDTLVVTFTNMAASCSAPIVDIMALNPDCGPNDLWSLSLFIPPALQGSAPIDLQANQIYFYGSEQFAGDGSGSCGAGEGGGPGKPGTLVIDSSDPTALRFTLSGGTTAMSTSIDGAYTAVSCP